MKKVIYIDGQPIGPGHKPYIICELSGNHNGSLDRALELIDAAATTGCDALRYKVTPRYNDTNVRTKISKYGWNLEGHNLYPLYQEAYTPFEWHGEMFQRAKERGDNLLNTF